MIGSNAPPPEGMVRLARTPSSGGDQGRPAAAARSHPCIWYSHKIIDKAGAWYTYGDVRVQGRDSMKEYLREHPDVSDKIEAEIRANAHKLMSPQARKAAIASGRAVEVAADDFQG